MNVKFIIEGMEETGSNGLDDMIVAQKDTFFSDVDYIIISDCVWLSKRPAMTYGTRGNCYFFAEVLRSNHSDALHVLLPDIFCFIVANIIYTCVCGLSL